MSRYTDNGRKLYRQSTVWIMQWHAKLAIKGAEMTRLSSICEYWTLVLATGLAVNVADVSASSALAQKADSGIEGSWSGGGRVILPSGDSERTRCRATFRRQFGTSYGMSATCATSSARIAQVATLKRIGASSYAGRFRNDEYDVNGSIHITVRGSRLSASLSGSGGSARLTLTR